MTCPPPSPPFWLSHDLKRITCPWAVEDLNSPSMCAQRSSLARALFRAFSLLTVRRRRSGSSAAAAAGDGGGGGGAGARSDCVRVAARVRAPLAHETAEGCLVVIDAISEENSVVVNRDSTFSFDHVSRMEAGAREVTGARIHRTSRRAGLRGGCAPAGRVRHGRGAHGGVVSRGLQLLRARVRADVERQDVHEYARGAGDSCKRSRV